MGIEDYGFSIWVMVVSLGERIRISLMVLDFYFYKFCLVIWFYKITFGLFGGGNLVLIKIVLVVK